MGLDPGQSTGLYVLQLNEFTAQLRVARYGVYQGPPTGALKLLARVLQLTRDAEEDALVAAERYTVTGKTGLRSAQPIPLQVIGQAALVASDFGVRFILQNPSDAKRIAPNELLRRVGHYVRPSEVGYPDANDANDAARHALLCLAKNRATLFDALLGSDD